MKSVSGSTAHVRFLKSSAIALVFGITCITTFVMLLRESELLGAFGFGINKPVPLRSGMHMTHGNLNPPHSCSSHLCYHTVQSLGLW